MLKNVNNETNKGIIFDIQRYSLHDGKGIRTLVFMKGCPIKCIWCSNPESQSFDIEVGTIQKDCVDCGFCYKTCKQKAIQLPDYRINRSICINCLECSKVCPVKSKRAIGREISVNELADIVEKDRVFFKNSGGGITVGGGEPAGQSAFVSAFLAECKERNLNTAVETCGFATWDDFSQTVEHADFILYDLKHMDSDIHKEITGASNELILNNLEKICEYKDVIIRVPVIADVNDSYENISGTIMFARKLKRVKSIEFLPYHTLGLAKYNLIGKEYKLKNLKPYSEDQTNELSRIIDSIDKDIDTKVVR
jgi:pyruvate formate lyase activating enzyme